jgi:hypothetical protein
MQNWVFKLRVNNACYLLRIYAGCTERANCEKHIPRVERGLTVCQYWLHSSVMISIFWVTATIFGARTKRKNEEGQTEDKKGVQVTEVSVHTHTHTNKLHRHWKLAIASYHHSVGRVPSFVVFVTFLCFYEIWTNRCNFHRISHDTVLHKWMLVTPSIWDKAVSIARTLNYTVFSATLSFSFLFLLRHVSAALGHHQVFCYQSCLTVIYI